MWDKDGTRYGQGKGLRLLVDGKQVASADKLGVLTAKLPPVGSAPARKPAVNYLVNNDGDYFPQVNASFTAERVPLSKLNDGNYWYHLHPTNRWTTEGSPNATDSLEVDLGVQRPLDNVKLYFLDDGEKIVAPERFELEHWTGQGWAGMSERDRRMLDFADAFEREIAHQGPARRDIGATLDLSAALLGRFGLRAP